MARGRKPKAVETELSTEISSDSDLQVETVDQVQQKPVEMPKSRLPILIGCKLPHGLVLELGSKKVTLEGLNKIMIKGADHKVNYIDSDFWAAWKNANPKFPALVSGAIFEGKNDQEVAGKAKEYRNRVTGFERLQPESMGVKKATASDTE